MPADGYIRGSNVSVQNEIRQRVTNKIISALQSGGLPPWKRPWSTGLPVNAASGYRYSGINPILLQCSAVANGWSGKWWATYRQWSNMGCQVRARPAGVKPGEWATKIILCKPVERTAQNTHGEEYEEKFWVMREFSVFAVEQVEGPAADKLRDQMTSTNTVVNYEPADAVLRGCGADIRFGGDRAYYSPTHDYVQLPPRAAFASPTAFYSTALHELIHWTGHESRLNRLVKTARYGTDAYAVEELIAEIGAAYLCTELGVPQADDLANTAAYLAAWLRVLRGDPSSIFKSATMASKAVDLLVPPSAKTTDAEYPLAA